MRRKTVDTISVLTDAIKNILLTFSKNRSFLSALVQRANIILLSSYGVLNRDIAVQVGLHYNHVATWRNRFLNALPALRELESADPDKLEKEIRFVLADKKRSGAPPVFTADQIMKIIDLACSDPGDWGHEVSQW